jgi:beta-glucosidase
MKKSLKITGLVLTAILVVLLLSAFFGYRYFNAHFLAFETGYEEKKEFSTIEVNGNTFVDRNDNGQLDPYEDPRLSIEERVIDALSQMTLAEKIHLLKGSGIGSAMGNSEPGEGIPGAVGTIVPTPRLGLPTIYLSDGPAGLRIQPIREGEDRTYYTTAFPIASLLAASWNTDLVEEVGHTMGNEAAEYGLDVILGPGVNIHRHPLTGRNFEYFSEDPVLTGQMGAAIVNGIESNGIGTSVKHYVANNQETQRDLNDVLVSERAMREIYLKGFEIIVKESQPWTIMSSYNKVNGEYTSESEYLLTDVLRKDWGFEGLVMTDWFGGRDAVAQISAGNDLLEPGTKKQWEALEEGAASGELTDEVINRAAGRILELIFKSKKMQDPIIRNNPDLVAHAEVTRRSGAEGMVLLKNKSQTLPLKPSTKLALLGRTSYQLISGGTGSGDVQEAYSVSLEEGLQNYGFQINRRGRALYDSLKAARADEFVQPTGTDAIFNPYLPPELTYTQAQLKEIADASDLAILTLGRNSGEGGDRLEKDDFLLTTEEEAMLTKTVEVFHQQNKPVIVVLNIGGVIETASWKDLPDAILLAWQGGQEGGNSIADILVGQVNPSGKLPMTFPIQISDHASHKNFPLSGEQISMLDLMRSMLFQREETPEADKVENEDYTRYEEGIYVGYRHFDKAQLEVSYPFGYGLSYTKFELSDLRSEVKDGLIHLNVLVKNVGELSGKEVVQVYVEKIGSNVDRPIRELKTFKKTELIAPGTSQQIQLSFPITDLAYWDEAGAKWEMEAGEYVIHLGNSSRDSQASISININE